MTDTPPPVPANGPAEEAVHHLVSERQKRNKKKGKPKMQPPLTPMIDVVFQLLLFFLLGCRFIQEEGQIHANLPNLSGEPAPSLKKDPIKIQLSPVGDNDEGVRFEISGLHNEAVGDVSEVYDRLRLIKQKVDSQSVESEIPVIITPRGRVRWKFVVGALNQAIAAKYKSVSFSAPGG